MSIFKRDCPECARPNPPSALLCACGYCFDPDALAESDPAAYARQQDRLYVDYLKARLVQAQADLAEAQRVAAAEPNDAARINAVRAAEAALQTLRNELIEWSRHAPGGPARAAAPVKAAPRPAATRSTPTAAPARTFPPPHPRRAAAPVEPAPRPAATRSTPTAAPARTFPPPHPRRATPPATPRVTAQPSSSFRQAQAQKAEAVVQSQRTPLPRPVAASKLRTGPAFASTSTASGAGASQKCPNCTATVAATAPRCRCGYEFPKAGNQVPALSLDAAALAILAEDLALTGPRRR